MPLVNREQIRLFLEEQQQFLECRVRPGFRHATERIERLGGRHLLASDGFALDRCPQILFDRVVISIVSEVRPKVP